MFKEFLYYNFRWKKRDSRGYFAKFQEYPTSRLKSRRTDSYADLEGFGLFRCEHRISKSGQVKFSISKRKRNTFRSLTHLNRSISKKKRRKYSDCKIFGHKVRFSYIVFPNFSHGPCPHFFRCNVRLR